MFVARSSTAPKRFAFPSIWASQPRVYVTYSEIKSRDIISAKAGSSRRLLQKKGEERRGKKPRGDEDLGKNRSGA
ncbi:hypothetical protein TNCT_76011 [Trichonephila clavata]|uniref:Uncharacterized protein n=1 Tax=Trichonephila clavata TaxID=2740835 RepID=A0A8X6GN53_TRICU|nr:hypothetical protein TNCT_76011 [Trichonephila clavata]